MTDTIEPMAARIDQQQLAQELVDKARADGVELVGPDGMLTGLTKSVLETALDAEMTDHVGYDKHDPAGRNHGNSRNGTRTKTVVTEIGPVQIEVPRDRDGSFEPQLVRKRQRRLTGAEQVNPQQLAEQLLAQAKEQGLELVGPDGLLNQLTMNVLETALEAEMTKHLG